MIDTSKNMLYHIGNLNAENQRISHQMASGEKLKDGSDDALLHANLIDLDDKLRVTEGLKLQIAKSKVMNETSDTSMKELKLLLGAKETNSIQNDLLKGLNSGMDRSDKLALATNLRGIRENMFDLANERVDGEYVFTGSDTSKQTLIKDKDFDLNGKVTYGGDGFLREVAVQPGSYRDRGITGYDVNFYTASKAYAGDSFTFAEGERIIDENGFEWKLNTAGDELQKYDYNGNVYHPLNDNAANGDVTLIKIDSTVPSPLPSPAGSPNATNADAIAGTGQYVPTTYTISSLPSVPAGRVFEAKHNYFDDLNIIINALEGKATQFDGTTGATIDDEIVRKTVSNGLELTTKQFDASNVGHGELGGRNNVFNVAYNKLEAQETHYNILIQQTGGADLAKLAMESKALELTYQSLYTTISKMNKLSLLNYLD